MKSGVKRIKKERNRQMDQEGYHLEGDLRHSDQQLVYAAMAYIAPKEIPNRQQYWPFPDDEFNPSGDRLSDLVKGGALIAAEIDRLQLVEERYAQLRKEKHKQPPPDLEALAKILYTRYCEAVRGFDVTMGALTEADEFFTDPDKAEQADAWRAVATASESEHLKTTHA